MIINLSCYVLLYNEKGKQHTVGTIRNSNQQMVDINTIDSINTYIHDHSLVWLSAGTSIQSDGDRIVLGTKSSTLGEINS
jgi:hypothetical protein